MLCIDHPAVQQMIPRLSDRRIITYGFSPQADVRADRVMPDKLGCTPCHDGQGPAINSVALAHGDTEFWERKLLTGPKMEARCA